jgi:hypothetical protein
MHRQLTFSPLYLDVVNVFNSSKIISGNPVSVRLSFFERLSCSSKAHLTLASISRKTIPISDHPTRLVREVDQGAVTVVGQMQTTPTALLKEIF